MLTDTTRSPYAKVHALDGMKVKWTGGLWKERFDTCANSTVPQLKHMFDSKDISHVVENFKICAGDAEGDFDGTVFGDGDFYKWMESAIYTAYQTDNQLLKEEIENYIDLIGRAQQADGYLSTKQIIGERTGNGVSRMGDINEFEVYNFGHMFIFHNIVNLICHRNIIFQACIKTQKTNIFACFVNKSVRNLCQQIYIRTLMHAYPKCIFTMHIRYHFVT